MKRKNILNKYSRDNVTNLTFHSGAYNNNNGQVTSLFILATLFIFIVICKTGS